MTTEETTEHLNDLIAVAIDGSEGYTAAAEHVADPHFQTVFAENAKRRAGYVKELHAEVERLGGQPISAGTLGAAVHRGWIDIKAAVTGGASDSIVAACETGEDAALAAYDKVVNSDISGEPRVIVEKQRNQIKEAHQRLLNLKRHETVE